MRRFGVTFYFGGTYLAQLLLVAKLRHAATRGSDLLLPRYVSGLYGLVALMLALGLASIPVSNFVTEKDVIENAIEWNFCLLLLAFYAISWRALGQVPRQMSRA
jgi:hypothetical protein